jgi:hypothetical protein
MKRETFSRVAACGALYTDEKAALSEARGASQVRKKT